MRALIILIAFTLSSCIKAPQTITKPLATDKPYKASNLSYGSHQLQKMDIDLPANRSKDSTHTVVLIHGGGWSGGDKNDMRIFVDTLRIRFPKVAIINLNYRLAANGTNLFPTQENDIKTALEAYQNKANDYAVSNTLVLIGVSAGAHLALLHGYKNDGSGNVKSVVSYAGPTDLTTFHNANVIYAALLQGVIGKSQQQDPIIYSQSSPANFVSATSPPSLLIHGDADVVVPYDQATSLATKLQQHDVTYRLITYPGEGHGFSAQSIGDAIAKTDTFIRPYLQ